MNIKEILKDKPCIQENDFAKFFIVDNCGVIICNQQSDDVFELPSKALASLFQLLRDAKSMLAFKLKIKDFTIEWPIGKSAGPQDQYPYVLIIPRYEDERYSGDTLKLILDKLDNRRRHEANEHEFVDDFSEFLT